MDLTISTRRPEREHACPACRWDWQTGDGPPDHTCRTPPTTPRTTIEDQARTDDRVLADRERQVRATRLAELRRGYAD